MNLKIVTIFALVFTAIGALIAVLLFANSSGAAFMGRDGYKVILILNMLKDGSLALFFFVLYSKQKATD